MPKNAKKSKGNEKLQLSKKQFEDLIKEIGGFPEGITLDPGVLTALREATSDQLNLVAREKHVELPVETGDEELDDQQTAKQSKKQQTTSSTSTST